MSGMTGSEVPAEPNEGGGRALKLQTDTPHLVNIGGDRLSTSVTLHQIPQGRVTLGCGAGVDIPVLGTGVLPLHCHIENSEGVVTIYPLSENLSIDGVQIDRPTRLSQGVMLTIGRSNYMRFNHPAEAKIMKSVLPNPRISVAPMTFEPENVFHPKYNKKPPAVPKKNSKESLVDCGVEEPLPSSIMTKVSKFEYWAQQNFKKSISPKVFSANSVTVNTPAKDVLGKSPPDIQNFEKNLPQNALNYSELNSNEKPQVKTAERALFGKKSPQYVNVELSENKHINNRVIIYENGCIPKSHNVNLDHNDLNNKPSSAISKNINVNKINTPSPSYNRNPASFGRSVTPSPVSTTPKIDCRRSGSMGELVDCLGSAEMRRTQAHQERVREQEMGKAEQARLEEILNMCVEYEKQSQCEKNKITPNRIKTNGSLPRDRRQYGPLSPVYTTPPPSPADTESLYNDNRSNSNHSYENVDLTRRENSRERINAYENVELRNYEDDFRTTKCSSPYENVYLQQNPSNIPTHSPRTRIKTIVSSNRDLAPKETSEIIENQFAILEAERQLLENRVKTNSPKPTNSTKFIFPLEDPNLPKNEASILKTSERNEQVDKLRQTRKDTLAAISQIKTHLNEIEINEEELHRDIDLEYALITGEYKSKYLELNKFEIRKGTLAKRALEIEEKMLHRQAKQEKDQEKCKEKLEIAQLNMTEVEEKLAQTSKNDEQYERIFEKYLKAQESLDNERKSFEDLEFHHLEEEADWLASREEVQREIVDLSGKIEAVAMQIQELEQQKCNMSVTNNAEFKAIKRRKVDLLMQLDKSTNALKQIDANLGTHLQESEQEDSTDSDSDKSKELENQLSNMSLNLVHDMSCSVIVSNTRTPIDHVYNMSQSFNEKLLQEKSILESGTKFPSQDDIDRICKVTSSAPINYDEEQGSLGRKTIESLKEIEVKRRLHLSAQGSQVIEQERQRVLALKQRVQQEVMSTWALRRRECHSGDSSEFTVQRDSNEIIDQKTENGLSAVETNVSKSASDGADSPRPMSDISEMSVEYGGTIGRKRTKTPSDKQRPLTRYLPIRGSDLDLRQHIESAGHQVVLCPHVIINSNCCRGFLHKKGSKLNGWSKRWFVFDRNKHTFTYYNDKSEKKPRGGAYFQAIEEVYLDHLNSVKSPNAQLTFIVKTHQRFYYLLAPSPEAMRIWVDVIFTGAEGYREFEHGT